MKSETVELQKNIEDVKDFSGRSFSYFTRNFYVMRSVLRYFSVRKGTYFTSSQVAEDFPLSVPVAASCLNVLEELEVVSSRTKSSSPDRYVPQEVDLDRLDKIKSILLENREIRKFK